MAGAAGLAEFEEVRKAEDGRTLTILPTSNSEEPEKPNHLRPDNPKDADELTLSGYTNLEPYPNSLLLNVPYLAVNGPIGSPTSNSRAGS